MCDFIRACMLKLVIVHFVFALLSSFIFALLPSNQVWLIVYFCFTLFVLFVHLCCVPSVLYSLVIDTGHKRSWEHPYFITTTMRYCHDSVYSSPALSTSVHSQP